ncbi:hypothetical protein Tco_0236393 [Tanacetum coccineum]
MTSSSKTNSPNFKRKTARMSVKYPNYVNLTSSSKEQPNERTPSPHPRKKSFSPPQAPSKSISSKSIHYTSLSSPSESPTPTYVAPLPKLYFVILIKQEPQELPLLQISPNDPYAQTMDNWPPSPSNPSPPPRVSRPPLGFPNPPPGFKPLPSTQPFQYHRLVVDEFLHCHRKAKLARMDGTPKAWYNNPDYLDERHRHRYEVNLDVVISKFKVQMSDNSNDADSDSYLLDDNFRYIYKQIIKFQFSFNTMSKEWIVDLTTLTSAFRVTLGSSIAGTSGTSTLPPLFRHADQATLLEMDSWSFKTFRKNYYTNALRSRVGLPKHLQLKKRLRTELEDSKEQETAKFQDMISHNKQSQTICLIEVIRRF